MSNTVIEANGLAKVFNPSTLNGSASRLFKRFQAALDYFLRSTAAQPNLPVNFWALQDVSFEVKRGEVVGIVGRNGAGKSTLLKILARIIEPSRGTARIVGKVGSLLEVGTGFHPELTGRENVFLNGAILGMRRRDILRHFDDIVDFAEISAFIDMPVKHYSSGMYMRLAFSVAAHLLADVLIMDEILAVGDGAFQRKCLARMHDISREGRTILFVSHDLGAVQRLCVRCIYLENGKVRAIGSTSDVLREYGAAANADGNIQLLIRSTDGNHEIKIRDISCLDNDVPMLSDLSIAVDISSTGSLSNKVFGYLITDMYDAPLALFATRDTGFDLGEGTHHGVDVRFQIPFAPGQYKLKALLSQDGIGLIIEPVTIRKFTISPVAAIPNLYFPSSRTSATVIYPHWRSASVEC